MNFCIFTTLSAFFMCASLIYAEDEDEKEKLPEEDDVIILTDSTFDDVTRATDIMLIEFYAPWCGHCKALAPEYSKAAKILKEFSPPVALAKVDATVENDLATRFEINSYPALAIFRKGERSDYDGPRDAAGIVDYMKQQADPSWQPPATSAITVTEENFSEIVDNEPLILVEFYAPWCGHCKRLAPEYERAAKELQSLQPPIPLAKIDGTVEKKLADKYKAHGWPTLKIFRNGRDFEYKGPRDAKGIVNFMKEQSRLPSQEFSDYLKYENAFNKNDVTVFGFYKDSQDSFYNEYIAAANSLRDKMTFLHTFDDEVAKHYKAKQPSVVLYQPEIFQSKYEAASHAIEKVDATANEIEDFIVKNSVPLVGHRTRENAAFKYANRPIVVVYYDVNFDFQYRKATQIIRSKIVEVAKDFPNVKFCVAQEEEFEEELKNLGLVESGSDVNIGFYDDKNQRFALEPDDDFDSETLRNFVEEVMNGGIEPQVKSQPIPQRNDGPVRVVVAKTFKDIVLRSSQDVLLEFYAPWCGHCKAIEPVYLQLAKNFKDDKNLIIAKMDATSNDVHPIFQVQGFPTLYFIPAANKDKPIPYEEPDRNIKSLTKFIEKHSSFQTEDDLSRNKDEL